MSISHYYYHYFIYINCILPINCLQAYPIRLFELNTIVIFYILLIKNKGKKLPRLKQCSFISFILYIFSIGFFLLQKIISFSWIVCITSIYIIIYIYFEWKFFFLHWIYSYKCFVAYICMGVGLFFNTR